MKVHAFTFFLAFENMKTLNCLLLAFLFLSSFTNAQDGNVTVQKNNTNYKIKKLTSRCGGKYRYLDKIYTRKELPQIIKGHQQSWNYYRQYETIKKDAKVSRIVSGVFFAICISQIAKYDIDRFRAPEEQRTGRIIAFSFVVGSGAGLFALGSRISANNKLSKSIKYFNGEIKDKELIGFAPLEFNLQYSENGLGLVLNF